MFAHCKLQDVTVDLNQTYRLIVAALSEASHNQLELPSDGRTISWASLTLIHADAVLARDPSIPFPAGTVEALLAELTAFSRAQTVQESTMAAARGAAFTQSALRTDSPCPLRVRLPDGEGQPDPHEDHAARVPGPPDPSPLRRL